MAENKTKPTAADVSSFIDSVENDRRREDARTVDAIMRKATGEEPKMWGPSIIGYGDARYAYASGRTGDWFTIGFSPRKANLVFYFRSLDVVAAQLAKLGKYKTGKGCLYVNKLGDIDLDVLREMIAVSAKGGSPS